jgi:hypothetical protein
MDWVLPTNEIMVVAETATSEEGNIASPKAADQGVEDGLTAQLRKFAINFKRAFNV